MLILVLTLHTVGHFKFGILLFLLWGVNWCYVCRKSLSSSFKFWFTFEEQHNLLSVPTLLCDFSHCATHRSPMLHLYSSFGPGMTLIVTQGQRWYSSHFTRICVSHPSYFLDTFIEVCFVSPLLYVCSLLFPYYI